MSHRQPIVRTDEDGQVLQCFHSLNDAARAGFVPARIRGCLQDPTKRHKGYRWRRARPSEKLAMEHGG